MTTSLVIVGAGGFGRETLDVVAAINRASTIPVFAVVGVVDANPSTTNLARILDRQIAYLGTEATWLESGTRAEYLVGVGTPALRKKIVKLFEQSGLAAATVIHPSASIGSEVRIGEGTVICGGVQVSTNVSLGRHVHLNPNSTIGHDTAVADFVSINPAAVISGEVSIGEGVLVGAGAVVLQGIKLAEGSVVGASACVVRDVAERTTVKGVPAR